jgi:hypothetical protein
VDISQLLSFDVNNMVQFAVGHWLSEHPEKIIRAYFSRWNSDKDIPTWRKISTMTSDQVPIMVASHIEGNYDG